MGEHIEHHEHEHGHGSGCECKSCACCGHEECDCECGSGHGHSECCEDEEEDMAGQMLKLADEAWGELLKEKMKKLLEKSQGAKLDKIAEICVEAAHDYYMGQMSEKAKWAEFEEKLNAAMMD